MTTLIDYALLVLIGLTLASLLFRVVYAVEVTASVPLTAENYWTTYHTMMCIIN